MILISLLVGLWGCSGNGAVEFRVDGDTELSVGQSGSLFAYIPGGGDESSIRWQQVTGPPLSLLVTDEPLLAFEPGQAGDYEFTVRIEAIDEEFYEELILVKVSEGTGVLPLRRDQAVREGARVSLRAGLPPMETSFLSIEWTQIAGPTIPLENPNQRSLFFRVPDVERDTLVRFRAIARSATNEQYTDEVAVFIMNAAPIPQTSYFRSRTPRMRAYRSNSPYKDALERCVYDSQLSTPCSITDLPLLGQDTMTPSIEDLLDRVVVSHEWMGPRFEEFLRDNDPFGDYRRLMRSVTAIVIAYDIRPSFYYIATAAIYLDPENFWLLPEERDTVYEAPDYRTNFGAELQFYAPWRLVKNGEYASVYRSRDQRILREFSEHAAGVNALLYHELAHANDYQPISLLSTISEVNFEEEYRKRSEAELITSMHSPDPPSSEEMYALAEVRYKGHDPDDEQKNYSPIEVAGFFSTDSATHFYSYTSPREDFAMLFEELMMSARYNVAIDVAFTNHPESIHRDSLIVAWGQRGRVGSERLKERARSVFHSIFPELAAEEVLSLLPKPRTMRPGESWAENLILIPQLGGFLPKQHRGNHYSLARDLKPPHH